LILGAPIKAKSFDQVRVSTVKQHYQLQFKYHCNNYFLLHFSEKGTAESLSQYQYKAKIILFREK